MGMGRAFFTFTSMSVALLFAGTICSADLVEDLNTFANSPSYSKRVGLEVELSGLSMNQIVNHLIQVHGGQAAIQETVYKFVDPETSIEHDFKTRFSVISQSDIDAITVKPEDNQPTLHGMATSEDTNKIYEIVSSPMPEHKVARFQKSLDLLKNSGGIGTSENLAVALQVNVEMGKGELNLITTKNIINILRNFLSEPNRSIIARHLNLPDIRKKFVGMPSAGLMKRIMDPSYLPTWDEFYMDSMYRANLESIGIPDAWTMPENQARKKLKELIEQRGFEIILPMMKWQYVRYSSLMMHIKPNDWLSQFMKQTDWFHSHPILEFREPSNHFDAEQNVKWILSLIAASEDYGVVRLDQLPPKDPNHDCGLYLRAAGF